MERFEGLEWVSPECSGSDADCMAEFISLLKDRFESVWSSLCCRWTSLQTSSATGDDDDDEDDGTDGKDGEVSDSVSWTEDVS